MARLVTGLFYERSEAENAVNVLREQGFAPEDIYLEAEVEPTGDVGRKGGQVGSAEQERRFAGLQTGIIIGLTVGLLAGMGMGILGSGITEMMRPTNDTSGMPAVLTNPMVSSLLGALMGLVAGGLIGWTVDFTLTRLGAGPARPKEETLVTVRCDEAMLDQAYAALFRARARHLHVAERSSA